MPALGFMLMFFGLWLLIRTVRGGLVQRIIG